MWLIYKKELLELVRDRKTLIFTIILPTIILPLIMGGMFYFMNKLEQKNKTEILKYAVIGENNAPELIKQLKNAEGFSYQKDLDLSDIPELIREKKVKFVISIPADFTNNIMQLKQATLTLHYNAAKSGSKVKTRLLKVLDSYNKSLQQQQMNNVSIDEKTLEALIKPVKLETKSIAENREKFGEIFGGMAAYMLLIITLSGAIYPALDLGVGEKERQTLETLLLNPVPRWNLVMAKFLVIFTTGFLAVFLSLLSVLVWTVIAGQAFAVEKIAEILNVVGIGSILTMMLMLIPTSAIFAAILLAISIYARNFKEAQNYISPLMMLIIIPVIVAILPGVELTWNTAMIPLTNIALAMKEILKGTMDYSMLAAIFGSTSVLAGGTIWFCSRWFSKETVLFRS
ncbi:MAG TPA: ABC transporter permease [Aeromonadales bacterium]|nr:ABC transporter permease [Aeromonadales bacterium]